MSSSSDEGVIDPNPKKKRQHTTSNDDAVSSAKKSKSHLPHVKNAEGEEMLDIGGKKYINVRTFKGKLYVDIREYYEKDGQVLPGKKGVSLTQDQYLNFKKALVEVDEMLQNA